MVVRSHGYTDEQHAQFKASESCERVVLPHPPFIDSVHFLQLSFNLAVSRGPISCRHHGI